MHAINIMVHLLTKVFVHRIVIIIRESVVSPCSDGTDTPISLINFQIPKF